MLTLDDEPALASGHTDGSVRVMRYQGGRWQADEDRQPNTGTDSIAWSLCVLTLDGVPALASGHGDGSVRVMRYQDGGWQRPLPPESNPSVLRRAAAEPTPGPPGTPGLPVLASGVFCRAAGKLVVLETAGGGPDDPPTCHHLAPGAVYHLACPGGDHLALRLDHWVLTRLRTYRLRHPNENKDATPQAPEPAALPQAPSTPPPHPELPNPPPALVKKQDPRSPIPNRINEIRKDATD